MKLSLRLILFSSLTILLVICIAYVSILDFRVINKLEGVLWTVPAKVYARPLELAEGGNINIGQLKKELEILSYEQTKKIPKNPGEFSLNQNSASIFIRGFNSQEPGFYKLRFEKKNGKDPKTATLNQDKDVNKKACCKLTFLS